MADPNKKGSAPVKAEEIDAESPVNQNVDPVAVEAVQNELPKTVDESPRASVLVKTVWPNTEFHVEGYPIVRIEGTMLTKTQAKDIEDIAAANKVALRFESGDD